MLQTINPELMLLARRAVMRQKQAAPGDPMQAAAAPPAGASPDMGAQSGAAPPGMGAPPGMAAPPPPVDPAAMGMPPGMPPPAQPGMPTMPGAAAAPVKLKPEQMMQMLDFRLYNMQQQLTAIMNALGIQLPPDALVLPPGSTGAPPAEAALPGGPMDSGAGTAQAGGQAGGQADPAANSAIKPVEPMQGAAPQPAQPKTAAALFGEDLGRRLQILGQEPSDILLDDEVRSPSFIGQPTDYGAQSKAAALAALYRAHNQSEA